MGALGAFFGKNKLIALVLVAFMVVQAMTMVVGSVAAVSSFMNALNGNQIDANKCTGDYKQVVTGIFTDPSIDISKMVAGCKPDSADPSFDVSLWLEIIEKAQAKLGTGYDDDVVNALALLAQEAENGGANYGAGSGSYTQPVMGPLTDGWGPRGQVVPGQVTQSFHRGQDIAVPQGTPVHAAGDGTVVFSGPLGTYGNWVLINVGDGVEIGTAHASQNVVKKGDKVKKGQVIQLSGMTGAATGPHVHVEVHINGTAVNPVPWFQAKKIPLGPGGAGSSTGGGGATASNSQVQKDFQKMEQEHHDPTIWQAIIDYATAKINGATYNAGTASAIVSAANDHVGDKYVASRTGWTSSSQNYCAKSPVSIGGKSELQCGFDDASLAGYSVSKGLDLSLSKGVTVQPWNQSVSAEEQYLTNQGHGTVVNLATIMPGDLAFISYGGNLDNADHVVIYAGTSKKDGRDVKHWVEAVNDDKNIIDVYNDTPEWMSDYTYEIVRPYGSSTAGGAAPVTGTGSVADAQRYAQERIAAHSSWGWSVSADWSSLQKMWDKESSWNSSAQNNKCHTASPPLAEYQAYGIPQMCPGSNMSNAAAGGGSDWKTNYKTQVEAGLYYIHSRYGSPHHAWAVWQTQGWY